MGFFWDLIQQSQISDQHDRSQNLENRVYSLENELYHTRVLLHNLIVKLEEKFGEDIDGDGKIG
jgi:hypothetical protein